MKKLATNERGLYIVAIGLLKPLRFIDLKKLYMDLAASVKKLSFYSRLYFIKLKCDICQIKWPQ